MTISRRLQARAPVERERAGMAWRSGQVLAGAFWRLPPPSPRLGGADAAGWKLFADCVGNVMRCHHTVDRRWWRNAGRLREAFPFWPGPSRPGLSRPGGPEGNASAEMGQPKWASGAGVSGGRRSGGQTGPHGASGQEPGGAVAAPAGHEVAPAGAGNGQDLSRGLNIQTVSSARGNPVMRQAAAPGG